MMSRKLMTQVSQMLKNKMNPVQSICGLVLLLLIGCSANPKTETSYYILHQPLSTLTAQQAIGNKPIKPPVLLDIKPLAEYLNQPYLVMQLTDHQLQYARFHMWAEPLSEGIAKSLLGELNGTQEQAQFDLLDRQNRNGHNQRIELLVEHFHITKDSKVILAGQFWIKPNLTANKLNADDNLPSVKHQRFNFEQTLEQDGYPHSVAQMRRLIKALATRIVNTINSEQVAAKH